MKKIYLLLSAAGVISLSACEEKGPAIDFGTTAVAKDTTYMAKVETPDKKVVLVEELTGASCTPCVPAREMLAGIVSQHEGQIAVMEMHIFANAPQTKPIKDHSQYDLRTDDGTEIQKAYYSDMIGIPVAGIDRVPVNNVNALTTPSWAGAIDKELQKTPPVNVKVKSTYDESSKNAVITITASYTQAVSKKQFLSVAILEKDIVDAQETTTGVEPNYTFKHTFRDMITGVNGDEFLKDQATKDAGRVYERTFIYPVDAKWKPENCVVVAYVHGEGENKEVLQAGETDLKGQ
ncbi:Omp28-related outer membrane protein [Polluticoccus soli]|uniref:Omp28-related outer membrane protein n=1 Tax=Polluticoccus soli TaxID=3034150 RepID=UPI0023E1E43D|nr:Omp28-related outer membrane protein [Flavipsychrobacter sp. JY13-12]